MLGAVKQTIVKKVCSLAGAVGKQASKIDTSFIVNLSGSIVATIVNFLDDNLNLKAFDRRFAGS